MKHKFLRSKKIGRRGMIIGGVLAIFVIIGIAGFMTHWGVFKGPSLTITVPITIDGVSANGQTITVFDDLGGVVMQGGIYSEQHEFALTSEATGPLTIHFATANTSAEFQFYVAIPDELSNPITEIELAPGIPVSLSLVLVVSETGYGTDLPVGDITIS